MFMIKFTHFDELDLHLTGLYFSNLKLLECLINNHAWTSNYPLIQYF